MFSELSPTDLHSFYEDGYLIVEDLFSREDVAEMAEAAERLRTVGRELAAALPVGDGEDAKGELKVEHAGSQFVFSGADGPRRLLRVVWAGGCEPAFITGGRDARLTSIVGQILGSSTAVHLLNQMHA